MVLLRRPLGEVLRELRVARGLTLRALSQRARVSLGYISEIERGQKEASSELLAALCEALETPLSQVLELVSERIAAAEGVTPLRTTSTGTIVIPSEVPDGVVASAA